MRWPQDSVQGLGFPWQRSQPLPRALSKETGVLPTRESPRTSCQGLTPKAPWCHTGGPAGGQLTYERFDGAVDVFVLLEAGGRGERLPAVWAGVGPGADMLGADVPLQVAGVREHLGTQTLSAGARQPLSGCWTGSHSPFCPLP